MTRVAASSMIVPIMERNVLIIPMNRSHPASMLKGDALTWSLQYLLPVRLPRRSMCLLYGVCVNMEDTLSEHAIGKPLSKYFPLPVGLTLIVLMLSMHLGTG